MRGRSPNIRGSSGACIVALGLALAAANVSLSHDVSNTDGFKQDFGRLLRPAKIF